jgi:hypothetical protein
LLEIKNSLASSPNEIDCWAWEEKNVNAYDYLVIAMYERSMMICRMNLQIEEAESKS